MKCGECHICKKEHYSEIGGWIINAEKKLVSQLSNNLGNKILEEILFRLNDI